MSQELACVLRFNHQAGLHGCVGCLREFEATKGYQVVLDTTMDHLVLCDRCAREHAPDLLAVRGIADELHWLHASARTGKPLDVLKELPTQWRPLV
jgi:hypothetical protein